MYAVVAVLSKELITEFASPSRACAFAINPENRRIYGLLTVQFMPLFSDQPIADPRLYLSFSTPAC